MSISLSNDPLILGSTTIPTITTADLQTLGTITLNSTYTSSYLNSTLGNISGAWGTPYITGDSMYGQPRADLHVQGHTEIQGTLKVNGVDVAKTLEQINQRLAILSTNPELESRWERLKALADEYRNLEKEIMEQEKIYDILKK